MANEDGIKQVIAIPIEWIIEKQITVIEKKYSHKGKEPIDMTNLKEVLLLAQNENFMELAMLVEKLPKIYLKMLEAIHSQKDK